MIDSTLRSLLAASAIAFALAGCGGGYGDDSGGEVPGPVNAAPTIAGIDDQSVDEDAIAGPIGMKIGDAETPAASLTVAARSSDRTLLPDAGIEITGEGEDRTLVLVPAPGQSGTATVTIEVADADGGKTATSFELTVNALFRGEFSSWMRSVALAPEAFDEPIGKLDEGGAPLPEVEDIPRIRFSDDSADDPAAYDDLLPAEGEVPPDD